MKRRLFASIVALAMVLTLLPVSVLATEANVAEVDGVGYATVAAAIDAAPDGGTVQLLPGTISDKVYHACEKSITIIGAANFGTKLTGGLHLGVDNSQCLPYTITVKGVAFEGKCILVGSRENVVI
ncbi:MAG: hypothetical protein IKD01_04610, partial [Oscillospiraceae bacterium]|nr:hypothetical protein [Oscillospiraceae bacterium]